MAIRELARQCIIDDLIEIGCVSGQMSISEFVRIVFPKANYMPTTDRRGGLKTAIEDIHRHMDNFNDWDFHYLFFKYLKLLEADEQDYIYFLEKYVHPSIRRFDWDKENCERIPFDNSRCVEVINKYLTGEGYELRPTDQIGNLPIYSAVSLNAGVQGRIKNIIFAAKYKPELVFDDALNNNVRITENANHCLIYDRPIPSDGLKWNALVEWYSEENSIVENKEKTFCKRLADSMDSEPERILLRGYYLFLKEKGIDGPALIPQVYLYYDPKTLAQRGYKLFEHQKFDFLMIFSHQDRVVIEIDGKQHYADGETASPQRYAQMVKAHRELSLYGYDVYRFGGYEFYGSEEESIERLKDFFALLFRKYGLET